MRLSELVDRVVNQVPLPEQPGQAPIEPEPNHAVAGDGVQPPPVTEQVRRALDFAENLMDQHGIDGTARDDIRSFTQLDRLERDINIYVLVESLKRRTGTNTAAYDFLKSHVFGTHVVNQLKLLLVAPHTMYYVTAIQEWALNHIHENPEAWKVPLEIINNKDQWEIFAANVRVRLTSLRSQIKHQVFQSHSTGHNINKAMVKIFPKHAVISDSHRARWAWILLSIDEFKDACEAEDSEYQNKDFWDFIEDQLAETKRAIVANPLFPTHAIQSGKFAEVFCRALSEHRAKFPITRITRNLKSTAERPAWQETIEEAIGMGREIYNS